MERENLAGDGKGKGASGSNREAESTDAPERGGLPCSSDEAGVMLVERRGRVIAVELGPTGGARRSPKVQRKVIAFEIGSTGNGRNPIFNGRRQPSRGGTSRMMREYQVRICERLGVKFPGSTRQIPGPTRQKHVLPQRGMAVRSSPQSGPQFMEKENDTSKRPQSRRKPLMISA
jgi:hypothetical protein